MHAQGCRLIFASAFKEWVGSFSAARIVQWICVRSLQRTFAVLVDVVTLLSTDGSQDGEDNSSNDDSSKSASTDSSCDFLCLGQASRASTSATQVRVAGRASARALGGKLNRSNHRIAVGTQAAISQFNRNVSEVAHAGPVCQVDANINCALAVVVASNVAVLAANGRIAAVQCAAIVIVAINWIKHTTQLRITAVCGAQVAVAADKIGGRAVASVGIALADKAQVRIRGADNSTAFGARSNVLILTASGSMQLSAVQASKSLQEMVRKEQPVAARQVSLVHALLSLQTTFRDWHCPVVGLQVLFRHLLGLIPQSRAVLTHAPLTISHLVEKQLVCGQSQQDWPSPWQTPQ